MPVLFCKERKMGGAGAMPARLDGKSICTVQTYTSFVEVVVGPLQPEGCEEQAPTFASHRVSKTDSRQSPTKRERMAILGTIKRFRQSSAGSTQWLFCSRNLNISLQ